MKLLILSTNLLLCLLLLGCDANNQPKPNSLVTAQINKTIKLPVETPKASYETLANGDYSQENSTLHYNLANEKGIHFDWQTTSADFVIEVYDLDTKKVVYVSEAGGCGVVDLAQTKHARVLILPLDFESMTIAGI